MRPSVPALISLFIATVGGVALRAEGDKPSGSAIIKAGRLIDIRASQVLTDRAILVVGERIKKEMIDLEKKAFGLAVTRGVKIAYGTDAGGYAWTENQAKEFSYYFSAAPDGIRSSFSEETSMTYSDTILPEFDHEMASTRKVLERLPDDKLDWRPHPKSNTIGWNANHLADLPAWAALILTQPQFDYAPVGGKRYESPKLGTRQEILDLFDRNVAAARKAVEAVTDDDMNAMWTLLGEGKPIFTKPRPAVMRSFVLNHMIHHRAILCVYLRLNDIPVPGMYGPSGDE